MSVFGARVFYRFGEDIGEKVSYVLHVKGSQLLDNGKNCSRQATESSRSKFRWRNRAGSRTACSGSEWNWTGLKFLPPCVPTGKGDDSFTLEVSVPANTTATIYVPATDATSVTESARPIHAAGGVRFLRMEGNRIVLAVDSGRYRFVSRSKN